MYCACTKHDFKGESALYEIYKSILREKVLYDLYVLGGLDYFKHFLNLHYSLTTTINHYLKITKK
jgi:hypothetical protein